MTIAPVKTGNTILAPPRLIGDPAQDTLAIQRWMQDLYDRLVKNANVTGELIDLNARVTALEARLP